MGKHTAVVGEGKLARGTGGLNQRVRRQADSPLAAPRRIFWCPPTDKGEWEFNRIRCVTFRSRSNETS